MKKTILALALMSVAVGAFAAAPQFDTFGSLPAATFGGSGIPNDAVAISAAGAATLGLTATARYGAQAPTNDGAGTFYALAGAPDPTRPNYAGWNFDYYVGQPVAGNTYSLFVDSMSAIAIGPIASFQDSWNLGFSFLGGATFDPNAFGTHTFSLAAFDSTGFEIGRSTINVDVGTGIAAAVPEPETYALMLAGLGFLGFVARRRKSA